MEEWERREGEGDAQWQAFQHYLMMTPRNAARCAELVGKSTSTIHRWAAKFEWRRRASAYDASLLEETRSAIRRELPTVLMRQWKDSADILMKAAAELKTRDLSRASFKSLNEICANFSSQLQRTAEQLKVFEESGGDKQILIKLVKAGEGTEDDDTEFAD